MDEVLVMKKKVKKGILYLGIGFVALFCIRLAYGYISTTEPQSATAALIQKTEGV